MIYTINKKNVLSFLLVFIFILSFSSADCGSCQAKEESTTVEKSNSLVTVIPDSGAIEGFAIASCGMCNFDYKGKRGCSLTIKIGDTVYPVEGTNIHEHGDPHSKEGLCSAVRVAYISGNVKKNKFYSDFFALIYSP